MLAVTIYDLDNTAADRVVGTIVWNDKSFLVSPDDRVLHNIVAERIVAAGDVVTKDNPERFMNGLHQHYRSPYLRAGKAVSGKSFKDICQNAPATFAAAHER